MRKGFFHPTELNVSKAPEPQTARCGACGLLKKCQTPKMPVAGRGKKGILIVGEAPGETEDIQGTPFVGVSGRYLRDTLADLGVETAKDCWLTNALICRPPANKTPDDKRIAYCRPNLLNTIKELQPTIIILLGGVAVKSLISYLWHDEPGGITRWVGWQIPSQKFNAWVCPTYHPAYLLRENNPVLEMYFRDHLKQALRLEDRPWQEIPDYPSQVERIINVSEASEAIQDMVSSPLVAFDYETDRLKPDRQDAEIVCCSLSNGTRTIAYPWHGKTIAATKELLLSPSKKIASNFKFEERWTLAKLGIQVKNWLWDTMLAAHVIDNRKDISGLKFQAFVYLGIGAYEETVAPYLKSKEDGANSRNRVKEVDLDTLLLYCGLDSLLEWQVAQRQMAYLGFKEK